MKSNTLLLILLIFLCNINRAQSQRNSVDFPAFKNYVISIVEDTTNHWSEYPKPPKVTDNVLYGMEIEIKNNDSAHYYLGKLSFSNYKTHQEETIAFGYLGKMDYTYSILALTANWNPDVRVQALIFLNQKLSMRQKVNSTKMKNGEWKAFDKVAIEFLTYLLEHNPLIISGSENSTIHSYYLSNIIWNLDLLTDENLADKKHISAWYKNDSQFNEAILKWKSHVK